MGMPWTLDPPEENNSALHCDDRMVYDAENEKVTMVGAKPTNNAALYTLLIDSFMFKKNEALKIYKTNYPERIPPADSGLPPLPMLVSHFCYCLWIELLDYNKDGEVDIIEVGRFLE